MQTAHEHWIRQAIALATENVRSGRGGPFGAVITKDGELLATGVNLVTSANDPTAHAEMVAIRAACKALSSFQLDGCDIYASCEPCPMCLGAIFWARPRAWYFACSRLAAAEAGFDDALIYDELNLAPGERSIPGGHIPFEACLEPFLEWAKSSNKIKY